MNCKHVCLTAFATLQHELYRVVDYDSKLSIKFHNVCMLEYYLISPLRCLLMIFLNFQNNIRVHVWPIAFATVQHELYHVVDYDSKWSTKFHNDCMLENDLISLSRRLLMIFIIFTIVLGPMSGPQLLQHFQIDEYRVVDYGR